VSRNVRRPLGVFALWLALAGPGQGGSVYESESVRVEFLEIGPISEPGVEVPIRFEIENRWTGPIGGTVAIGGPTAGIVPVGEAEQSFEIPAGETTGLEFPVRFAAECVPGRYPIHAFFMLSKGRGDRARLHRLVEPDFARAASVEGEEEIVAEVATFQPAPLDNVIDRFFETRRLSVIADYVRNLDEGEGRAFRLGDDEGAFRVMLVPGRQGLLDGYLYFTGPRTDLYFHGFEVTLRGPKGVTLDEEPEVVDYREEARENGLVGIHHVRIGDWETIVEVEVSADESGVGIRCESPDPLVEISLGRASLAPLSLTAGMGYRFEDPGDWEIAGQSPLLNVSWAGFEFAGDVQILMGSDEPLQGLRISSERNLASAVVGGDQWLQLVPTQTGLLPAVDLDARSAARPESSRKVPVIWLRRSGRNLERVVREVEALGRYEDGPTGLILTDWQHGGEDHRPPDSWPPAERAGGIAGLQRLMRVCREADVTLVLEDDYEEISPLSRGFLFEAVEFDRAGRPVGSEDGNQYLLRPDAAAAFLAENWTQIQFHLRPGALLLAGIDSAGHEFHDRRGNRYPPAWVRDVWRANLSQARDAAGEEALVLARGGGDWLGGAADAILAPAAPELPGPSERVPWWNLFVGGRTPLLEDFPETEGDPMQALTQRVLDGRLPVLGAGAWQAELLQRRWLLRPVFRAMRERELRELGTVDEEERRFEMGWGTDMRVWINRRQEPWTVNEHVVAAGGFHAEGPDLEGGIEIRDGVLCQWMSTGETRFVHPGCDASPAGLVGVRVEALSPAAEDRVELSLAWERPELLPLDSELEVVLSGADGSDSGTVWGGEGVPVGISAPRRILLPASEVPAEEEWKLWAIIRNSGGKPLPLRATPSAEGDRSSRRVYLGRVRRTGGEIATWEASWSGERESAAGFDGLPDRIPVDFGWVVTDGAIRLKQCADGIRIHPLPYQQAFEVRLRLGEVGWDPQGLRQVIARERRGAEWKNVPFRLEEDEVSFPVEPQCFAYDLLLDGGVSPPLDP